MYLIEVPSAVTRGIANAAAFAAMPMGSHFINVSRGEIAVEKDVIEALQSGRLAGAYLDVFEREPLPSTPAFGPSKLNDLLMTGFSL